MGRDMGSDDSPQRRAPHPRHSAAGRDTAETWEYHAYPQMPSEPRTGRQLPPESSSRARAPQSPSSRTARRRRASGLHRTFICAVALIAVIAVVAVVATHDAKTTQAASAAEVESGVSYIQQLEGKDPAAVEDQISDAKLQQERDQLLSGEVSVWSMFDDYVILGDSRAVGFYYYGFLDRSRVLAEGGSTIADVASHNDELAALDPKEIFLCYGLNDISIGYWDTVDEYIASLSDVINSLRQICPRATVYVSSTLPAQDPAFERSEKWYNIPDWNVAIKAWCEGNGVPYIDNTQICEEHSDMWDSDGIHVYPDFYQYWAANMITEVLSYEQGSAS